MDIAAASIAMNQNSLALAASIRVMSLAKEQATQQTQDMVQMMKQAQPHLGQSIDIQV
ncbi:YjfB family protein [Paenibacillus sp. TAF43_2]|uniref:YjfB family protein n=1 Tax=Paenibacillus sp. TAF43_2 TaxID=3233069 RepID=UPI003F94D59B